MAEFKRIDSTRSTMEFTTLNYNITRVTMKLRRFELTNDKFERFSNSQIWSQRLIIIIPKLLPFIIEYHWVRVVFPFFFFSFVLFSFFTLLSLTIERSYLSSIFRTIKFLPTKSVFRANINFAVNRVQQRITNQKIK